MTTAPSSPDSAQVPQETGRDSERSICAGCLHDGERTMHYTHVRCEQCGFICTDGGWGIASRKWFPSLAAAEHYRKTGRAADRIEALERECAALKAANLDCVTHYEVAVAECARLREALTKAAEDLLEASIEVESWGAYASPYFQQKHDLAGCVADYVKRAALARAALTPAAKGEMR